MSTDFEKGVQVEISGNDVDLESTSVSVSASAEIDLQAPPQSIEGLKKEYSIVGDGIYASVSEQATPPWLDSLITNAVTSITDDKFSGYSAYVDDIRAAIDSIDVAKNTFVQTVNFDQTLNESTATVLQTLNASIENVKSQIVDLDLVYVKNDAAYTSRVKDLAAEVLTENNITSARLTGIDEAIVANDSARAREIRNLDASIDATQSSLGATSSALSGLQSYVGLGEDNQPNGQGILNRLSNIENQADGVVDFVSGTYDVINFITDPNDPADDELVTNVKPYCDWIPIEDTVDPTNPESYLEKRVYKNTTSGNCFQLISGNWISITPAEFDERKEALRADHIGDVYIKYADVNSVATYESSFKFVKTTPDTTSPYATDAEGYTWAVVADTDSAGAYVKALEALQAAEGDISQFYAWGGLLDPLTTGTYTPSWSDTPENAATFVYWFDSGVLKHYKNNAWVAVPDTPGQGKYMSAGDMLVVFKPDNGDLAYYTRSGVSWVGNGPNGIFSKSQFYVELKDRIDVYDGAGPGSFTQFKIDNEAYTDRVGGTFLYDNKLTLNGQWYEAGFGLSTNGVDQTGKDGATEATAFDSEFWVRADKFKVLPAGGSPDGSQPPFFSIDQTTGQAVIGIDRTEATKNEFKGVYSNAAEYDENDSVLEDGILYVSKSNTNTGNRPPNAVFWDAQTEANSISISASSAFSDTPTDTQLTNEFSTAAGKAPTRGDTLIYAVYGAPDTANDGSFTAYYTGPAQGWNKNNVLTVNGDAVINGTLSLKKLAAEGTVSSTDFLSIADPSVSYPNNPPRGWAITGDGNAEFNQLSVRSSQVVGGMSISESYKFAGIVPPLPKGSGDVKTIGTQHPKTVAITNNYDQDGSVTVTGLLTCVPQANTRTTASRAKITITRADNSVQDIAYSAENHAYRNVMPITGSFLIASGETVTLNLYLAGSNETGSKENYFKEGLINSVLTADTSFNTIVGVDAGDDLSVPDIRIYRFMSSPNGTSGWVEDDNSGYPWIRKDYSDDGETWVLGTPVNLEGPSGSNGIDASLTTNAVTIPSDSAGVVTSYATTPTTITVGQGSDQLVYESGTLSEGKWKVVSIVTNWCGYASSDSATTSSVNSASDGRTYAAFGELNTTSADQGSVAYNLSIWPKGASSAISKQLVMTFTKSKDGSQGPKGDDGSTTYTWIRYADTPTSGMSNTATGKAYIGIATNKGTSIESNVYGDYTWSLIKGADGTNGTNGTNGKNAITASYSYATTDTITKSKTGTYSADYLQVSAEFREAGVVVGSDSYRINRSGDGWSSTITNLSGGTNAGRVSFSSLARSNQTARLHVDYSDPGSGLYASVDIPVKITIDGSDGANGEKGQDGATGQKTATVRVYKVSSSNSVSSNPHPSTTETYTWSSGLVSSMNNGWVNSSSKPSVTSTNKYLWEVTANLTAADSDTTTSIPVSAWGTPSIVSTYGDKGDPGDNGTNGSNGLNATRSAFGVLYKTTASSTAGSLSASNFNFSTGTFGSLTSGWSTSPPTIDASSANPYWSASFKVVEATYGGSQTVTLGTATKSVVFTEMVTFSDLSNNSSTVIHGGNITTGQVSANNIDVAGVVNATTVNAVDINANSITAGVLTGRKFQTAETGKRTVIDNSNANIEIYDSSRLRMAINADSHSLLMYSADGGLIGELGGNNLSGILYGFVSTNWPAIASLNGEGAAMYGTSYGSDGVVGKTTAVGRSGVSGWATEAGSGVKGMTEGDTGLSFGVHGLSKGTSAGMGGIFQSTDSSGSTTYAQLRVALNDTTDYASYADVGSTYAPFTGSHDALIRNVDAGGLTPGDIVVDKAVVAYQGISDAICEVEISSTEADPAVLGVVAGDTKPLKDFEIPPAAFVESIENTVNEEGEITDIEYVSPKFDLYKNQFHRFAVNSVGEGRINVCGRGGNIAVGDLIQSSTQLGKGMKQADGIIRNYTVAKAREAVTFSSPSQVKTIACTYHCG